MRYIATYLYFYGSIISGPANHVLIPIILIPHLTVRLRYLILSHSKQSNRIREYVHVVRRCHNTRPVTIGHGARANGVQVVDVDVRAQAFNGQDARLAVEGVGRWRACCLLRPN